MIETLNNLDHELFLLINGNHSSGMDQVMATLTQKVYWIWLYVLIIYVYIKRYKMTGFILMLGAGVSVIISDQITSGFMKPFFERLRPSHDPSLENVIHVVNDFRGGLYGFASSHASTSFALATFLCYSSYKAQKWVGILVPWAIFISFTRIYLGLHFPGDILVGALVGSLTSLIIFRLTLLIGRNNPNLNLPLPAD